MSNDFFKCSLEPITILRTQWKGVKSMRFYFIAFLHPFNEIPKGIGQSVAIEKEFLHGVDSDRFIYGVGTTPGNAMRNMYKDKKQKILNPQPSVWTDV
jgi:hypothetical protein